MSVLEPPSFDQKNINERTEVRSDGGGRVKEAERRSGTPSRRNLLLCPSGSEAAMASNLSASQPKFSCNYGSNMLEYRDS
jgi:hypothetical protein